MRAHRFLLATIPAVCSVLPLCLKRPTHPVLAETLPRRSSYSLLPRSKLFQRLRNLAEVTRPQVPAQWDLDSAIEGVSKLPSPRRAHFPLTLRSAETPLCCGDDKLLTGVFTWTPRVLDLRARWSLVFAGLLQLPTRPVSCASAGLCSAGNLVRRVGQPRRECLHHRNWPALQTEALSPPT